MSGSRRQRDSIAPSLFPFLAVLLCTMGSLVLILMLVVSGAQASAKQVEQESRERTEEIEATIDLAKQSYRRQLEDGRIDLEKKRLALQHFEKHILELMTELADLEKTAKLLDEKTDASEDEQQQLEKAISDLEKQLAEASQKLKQQVAKPDGDKPIFAIIPYEGVHGTHRRPIYLECVERGLIIQPEGVLIPSADLEPPHGPGNPLDAALRTIRSEFAPENGAVTRTAYPLLVVRPSGIRNYSLARGAMSGWDDQFGYELIDEKLELTFPESKPGLEKKIVQSIELARQRQAALVMAMPRKYRATSGGVGDSAGGGGLRRTASGRATSGSGLDRLGQASGLGEQSETLVGQGYGYGSQQAGTGGAGMGNGAGGWEAAMGNKSNASLLGDLPIGGSQSLEAGQLASGNATGAFGGSAGMAGGPSGAHSNAGLGGNAPGKESQGDPNQPPSYAGSYQAGAAPSSSFFGDQTASSHSNWSGDSSASGGESGGTSGSAAGNQQAGSGQSGTRQAGDQRSPDSQQGGQFAGSPPTSGPSAGNQSAGGQGGTSSSASAGGSSSPGSSFAAPSIQAMEGDPSQPMMPQLSIQNSNRTESAPPVSRSRGRNWAWSRGPATQTPVVRPLHLHCFSDRWVLLPDNGNPEQGVTIDFEGTPRERAEQLALAVLDRVDSWGLALAGGYWKPVIIVDVAQDAAWRFDQLVQLLDGSGLDIQLRTKNGARLP